MTTGRRTIRYANFDEITADVDRLLSGHITVGNWSLAQICRHLSTAMRRVTERPASTPYDTSLWMGEDQKRQFFESEMFPEAIPTAPALLPPEALSAREEAEALRQAIALCVASPGPVSPHVLLGFLTKEEWNRFHCIHAAHHLSFAIPTAHAR